MIFHFHLSLRSAHGVKNSPSMGILVILMLMKNPIGRSTLFIKYDYNVPYGVCLVKSTVILLLCCSAVSNNIT